MHTNLDAERRPRRPQSSSLSAAVPPIPSSGQAHRILPSPHHLKISPISNLGFRATPHSEEDRGFMAAIPPFRRPDRHTPSVVEDTFLKRLGLTLETLEFGLPHQLAAAGDFIAPDGDICCTYSRAALVQILDDNEQFLEAYILPHLPLADAIAIQATIDEEERSFRIANQPRFNAKVAAHAKFSQVEVLVGHAARPVEEARAQLANRCNELAGLLHNDAAIAPKLDSPEAFNLLIAQWEKLLVKARDAARAYRKRVILAVHLARRSDADENVFLRDDVHKTIRHLCPDLHDDIFLNPRHSDPCSELSLEDKEEDLLDTDEQEEELGIRKRRTEVAVGNLIRQIGLEVVPAEFAIFSLVRSRRDLLQAEGDVTRQELRLRVLKNMQQAAGFLASASRTLEALRQEVHDHLTQPSLLHEEFDDNEEVLPMDSTFFPEFLLLSEEDLQKKYRHFTTPVFGN